MKVSNKTFQNILDHLEEMDYKLSTQQKQEENVTYYIAEHEYKNKIVIEPRINVGFLYFYNFFGIDDETMEKIKNNKLKFLEIMNEINGNLFVCTFYFNEQDHCLTLSARKELTYSMLKFPVYVELFYKDFMCVMKHLGEILDSE